MSKRDYYDVLGVSKGASLVRFATFRDALENDFARKIVGFDAFPQAFEDLRTPTNQCKILLDPFG